MFSSETSVRLLVQCWFLTIWVPLVSLPAVGQDARGSAKGLIDIPHTFSGTPLLARFAFEYARGKAYHLERIMIWPGAVPSATMRVGFHDKGRDDTYFYNVTHHNVADARIRRYRRLGESCETRARCTVRIEKPEGDVVFVLVGFELAYDNIDHHVDEVSLLEHDGVLSIALNDRGDDTSLRWSVDYAYVPRDLFSQIGESWGVLRSEETKRMPGGVAVIRGFRFNVRSSIAPSRLEFVRDCHIAKIGILPLQALRESEVYVYHSRCSGEARTEWRYQWAILN